MSSFIPAVWDRLYARIQAVWPDVSVTFRGTQTTRINWRHLVDASNKGDASGLGLPYAVVGLGAHRVDPDSPMDAAVYRMPLVIWRIDPLYATAANGDIARYMETKLEPMRDDLWKSNWDEFQVVEEPTIDVSESNPANMLFSGDGFPAFGGSCAMEIRIGQVFDTANIP